jgi:hypothetical protein
MWSRVTNHPASLGSERWQLEHQERQRLELESLLLRLSFPRSGGQRVSGVGSVRFGFGSAAAGCDGSYSYFAAIGAPSTPTRSDPGRWAPHDVFSLVQADATGLVVSAFAASAARLPLRAVPLLDPGGGVGEVELAYQGFVLDALRLSEDSACIGERDEVAWHAGGEYATYLPLAANDAEALPHGPTLCASVGFGVESDVATCTQHERCVPGSDGCAWVKLPDSLCPQDELERARFGCHVGWAGNPDAEPAACAMPSTAAAAAQGAAAGVERGLQPPCCDPLGADPALRPCNAWLVKYEFVAGAVEIDDSAVTSVLRCGP